MRDILVGKESENKKHSYIKIYERPEIYMASGNLARVFDMDVASLRDKDIFKVV